MMTEIDHEVTASSEVLCREIQTQSESEATSILEEAQKDVEKIRQQAAQDAEKERGKILADAQNHAEASRKKMLSSVHLEVKKQTLKNREAILSRIFEEVRKKLEDFRGQADYAEFLKACAIEGALAVESEAIQVVCGKTEKKILSAAVLAAIQKTLAKEGRACRLALADGADEEGGVLVQSSDGRMRFDNRFSARIKRMEHRLRLEAMKAVFE
jgi:vacuolar-type H+-ATPase subunit E/Vma4